MDACLRASFIAITISLLSIPSSLLSIPSLRSSQARGIIALNRSNDSPIVTTYWGSNGRKEGSLQNLCDTGAYGTVIISSLSTFGNGRRPSLDLSDHCYPHSRSGCTYLSRQIRACQRRGIKVLLSVGGAVVGDHPTYTLKSAYEAKYMANYLWQSFLAGNSSSRPLGDSSLDGIDFDIEGGTNLYWDDLAEYLSGYSSPYRKVYLSAAADCVIPTNYIDSAIQTGLFDYVSVKFFANPSCEYTTNADNLVAAWNQCETYPGLNTLFLGLPAFPVASLPYGGGYVTSDELINDILPKIKNSPKLWRGDAMEQILRPFTFHLGRRKGSLILSSKYYQY